MGYYSSVGYVIEFKDKEQKETFLNLQKVKDDTYINGALYEVLDNGDNKIGFHNDSCKWYDDFKDVQAHHSLMEEAQKLFPDDVNWLFCRVGEQDDDIETDTFGDNAWDLSDYVNVVRYVGFDFSGRPVMEIEKEAVVNGET
jgi:hypothetical protein